MPAPRRASAARLPVAAPPTAKKQVRVPPGERVARECHEYGGYERRALFLFAHELPNALCKALSSQSTVANRGAHGGAVSSPLCVLA